MKSISIPIDGINPVKVESEHCFVIVGANGSGKSHLGARIESDNSESVLRISAQRALTIPENLTMKSEEAAWNKMFFGSETNKSKRNKWGWDNKTTTSLINDYESVLSSIFARNSNEEHKYVNECRQKENSGEPKSSTPCFISDKILDIWNSVFPHREIILNDYKITARLNGVNEYHAMNMSDGERVAIYLIGSCLVAPDGLTIVIDEPEIHLHKSIMHKLWDKIEEYCPNKTFVYITHDLDFAASRKEAKKIWIKDFEILNGTEKWNIKVLDDYECIPDSLMIEVLGNRRNILFVEGEKGSFDNQLYPYIYDDYYVIPCHNCSKVIEMTKAFNEEKVKNLHNFAVKGLIDRDYMTKHEIDSYKEDNIFTLDVAEVENLYLIEEIQRIIAEHLALQDVDKILECVKDFLFNEFLKEKDAQVASICEREVQFRLRCYSKKGNDVGSLKSELERLVSDINIDEIYTATIKKVDEILSSGNLNELLRIYNRKSLSKRISKSFMLNGDYTPLVLRLLKTDKKKRIVDALKKYTPQI